MDLGLKGKVALVTGGSRGIGKGITIELAREGANVAFCARTDGPLEATAREVEKLGAQALPLKADATNPKDIERTVAETIRTYGRLDILVNNAGGRDAADSLHWVEDPDDVWMKNYAINLWPVIRFSRLAVAQMRKQGGGNIVNVSSVSGHSVSWPGVSDYSSAKAAVLMLTLAWSVDLAADKIRVNCVNPALIRTPHWEELAKSSIPARGRTVDEVLSNMAKERLTVGRTGRIEEVGYMVAFLASDAKAGFVTGQCWNCDGGYTRTL